MVGVVVTANNFPDYATGFSHWHAASASVALQALCFLSGLQLLPTSVARLPSA